MNTQSMKDKSQWNTMSNQSKEAIYYLVDLWAIAIATSIYNVVQSYMYPSEPSALDLVN